RGRRRGRGWGGRGGAIHRRGDGGCRGGQTRRLRATARGRITRRGWDRQSSLSELAVITSAGPARALGLSQKGHLGVGADADVAIFNEDRDAARMFAYPRYVIKGGEVVLEEGEVRNPVEGKGLLVRPAFDEKIE